MNESPKLVFTWSYPAFFTGLLHDLDLDTMKRSTFSDTMTSEEIATTFG
ncbi:hypothetical protein [Devriesea agamarum]|nr:hypothetical protein [Devriesea agamarum]